jgi:hypothetical protein
MLTLKLIMTPLLIASVTLVGRRWGAGVSGWLMGFPLTSGPVSIFLALQYGRLFAAKAAVGTMGGIASVCVFCLVYSLVARKAGWPVSAAAAIVAFFVAIFLWNMASLALIPTMIIDVIVVTLILLAMPWRQTVEGTVATPRWDIPARMLVATAFVVGLTTFAASLGAQLSGLLSPFPTFSTVIAVFTHHQQGADTASQLLRGVVVGTFSFLSFFLVVAVLLPVVPMFWTYLAATAASIGVNSVALRFVRRGAQPVPGQV